MPISVHLFKMLEAVDPALRDVLFAILEEIEKQQKERVTKDEFRELRDIVSELGKAEARTAIKLEELTEAQKKTEKRLDSLTEKVEQLAEAQKRTEQRVEELTEAQKRTESRVEELAKAQERTEQRVEELAKAQEKTEKRLDSLTEKVEQLAEAQKETEKEIKKLAKGLNETRRMVGGLSDTVGYGLEDRAIASLPSLLKERYDITVDGPVVRKFINLQGREQELNMFGAGTKNGKKIFIIGEGKAKLSKKHVDSFEKLLNRLKTAVVIGDDYFPLLVTYTVRPEVEEYAASKGMHVIWSYDLIPY